MDQQSYYFVKKIYSTELKHTVCKEHVEQGTWLRDLGRKYNLSSHSLVHERLRVLGYLPGTNRRRQQSEYISLENFTSLPDKLKNKKASLTSEQTQIELLKRELEDAKIQAEGYRRMIEIAEQELKIPIRKSPIPNNP